MEIEHKANNNESDLFEIWHKRLGHVKYGSLMKMASDNLVKSFLAIKKPNKLC